MTGAKLSANRINGCRASCTRVWRDKIATAGYTVTVTHEPTTKRTTALLTSTRIYGARRNIYSRARRKLKKEFDCSCKNLSTITCFGEIVYWLNNLVVWTK